MYRAPKARCNGALGAWFFIGRQPKACILQNHAWSQEISPQIGRKEPMKQDFGSIIGPARWLSGQFSNSFLGFRSTSNFESSASQETVNHFATSAPPRSVGRPSERSPNGLGVPFRGQNEAVGHLIYEDVQALSLKPGPDIAFSKPSSVPLKSLPKALPAADVMTWAAGWEASRGN